MALPMTLIIIAGEIDLSVESMAGLSCAILGFLFAAGVPVQVGDPDRARHRRARRPAQRRPRHRRSAAIARRHPRDAGPLPRPRPGRPRAAGRQRLPDWFTDFGFGTIPGTPFPWPLLVFVGLAIVLGVVLHGTWIGRQIYAIGKNAERRALFGGPGRPRQAAPVRAVRHRRGPRRGHPHAPASPSARADVGQGLTLTVVTIVLLGGVNIFGGRGTIPGVVLAASSLAVLGNILRLTNVSAEIQSIAVGLLLIVSVVIPTLLTRSSRPSIALARSDERPPARSALVRPVHSR